MRYSCKCLMLIYHRSDPWSMESLLLWEDHQECNCARPFGVPKPVVPLVCHKLVIHLFGGPSSHHVIGPFGLLNFMTRWPTKWTIKQTTNVGTINGALTWWPSGPLNKLHSKKTNNPCLPKHIPQPLPYHYPNLGLNILFYLREIIQLIVSWKTYSSYCQL